MGERFILGSGVVMTGFEGWRRIFGSSLGMGKQLTYIKWINMKTHNQFS